MEKLIGLTVTSIQAIGWGTLSTQEENQKLYYIDGFMTTYSNGWKSVVSGGSASGRDFIELYILDEKNNIVAEYDGI